MTPEQERALRSEIGRAALDPSYWPQAIAALGSAVGRVLTHMHEFNPQRQEAVLAASAGFDEPFVRSWIEHYAAINPWAPGWSAAPVGQLITAHGMCPDEDVARTEVYADWILPQEDIIGGGGIVLARRTDGVLMFGGNYRRRDRDAVQPLWLDLVARLGPDVHRAVEVNRRLAYLSLESYLLRQGADPEACAVLIVGQQRRVLWANQPAEILIATGSIQTGQQSSLAPPEHKSTEDPVCQAIEAARFRAIASGPLCVGDGFRCRVVPLDPAAVPCLPCGPLSDGYGPFAILIGEPTPAQSSRELAWLLRLGLTVSEAAIAIAVTEGQSATEIAGARGTSVHTVRNQIKSMMAKTGTRRQAELAALVERLRRR